MATARPDDVSQPIPPEEAPAERPSSDGQAGSLFDDVEALVEDGKSYAEAEIAFQKARLIYAADHAKWAMAMGGLAIVLVVLALVALVIGVLIALIPPLGPWGSTAVVFGALAVCAAVLLGLAKGKWNDLVKAFEEGPE